MAMECFLRFDCIVNSYAPILRFDSMHHFEKSVRLKFHSADGSNGEEEGEGDQDEEDEDSNPGEEDEGKEDEEQVLGSRSGGKKAR